MLLKCYLFFITNTTINTWICFLFSLQIELLSKGVLIFKKHYLHIAQLSSQKSTHILVNSIWRHFVL